MREIKFRAWDNVALKMYSVGDENDIVFYFNGEKIIAEWVPEGDNFSHGEKLEHLVYMQCTGIKDKNGNLIFEGDIIDAPVEINKERFGERQYYSVGKLDGQFILNLRYIPEKEWEFPDGYQFGYLCKIFNYGENGYSGDDIEVIGNIYQNPELIKATIN